MGISRDRVHKRRLTGGRFKRLRSKRKFEMGRQPANTKLGDKKVNKIRVRGGNFKFRALRLDHGNFTWAGEATTRKTRILRVTYNATSNELVRTNTLVKGCIVQIDSTPFKQWYLKYYKIALGKVKAEVTTGKKGGAAAPKKDAPKDTATGKKDTAATGKKDTAAGKKDTAAAGKKDAAAGKKDAAAGKKDAAAGKKDTAATGKKDTAATGKKDATAGKKDATAGKKDAAAGKKDAAAGKKDAAAGKKDAAAGKKDATVAASTEKEGPKVVTTGSDHLKSKVSKRIKSRVLEDALNDQFKTGRLYARLTSSPGQSGRADGVVLEGEELAFYLRKMHAKKKK